MTGIVEASSNLAAEAGCEVFLNKPPDFDVLKATIDHLLQVKGRGKQIARAKTQEDRGAKSSSELFAWE
jgi:hypothetical protein